jgi:hypothetical protein
MWGDQMDQISVVGVIVTSAIVCITENSLDNYPFITRLIYFLAFEQILLGKKCLIRSAVSTT